MFKRPETALASLKLMLVANAAFCGSPGQKASVLAEIVLANPDEWQSIANVQVSVSGIIGDLIEKRRGTCRGFGIGIVESCAEAATSTATAERKVAHSFGSKAKEIVQVTNSDGSVRLRSEAVHRGRISVDSMSELPLPLSLNSSPNAMIWSKG